VLFRSKSENAQIPALKSEVAELKSENAQIPALTSEISRLIAGVTPLRPGGAATVALSNPSVPVPATLIAPVTPSVAGAPGALLAECLSEVESLPLDVKTAKLLLANCGEFTGEKWEDAVGDAVPTLVLLELANGVVCGGVAGVAWPKGCGSSADASGTSFIFSLRPKMARYALKSRSDRNALADAGDLKKFGFDLHIWGSRGQCVSPGEHQYVGPRGAGDLTGARRCAFVGIIRLEVWQL
jgi:hypothetical protein